MRSAITLVSKHTKINVISYNFKNPEKIATP